MFDGHPQALCRAAHGHVHKVQSGIRALCQRMTRSRGMNERYCTGSVSHSNSSKEGKLVGESFCSRTPCLKCLVHAQMDAVATSEVQSGEEWDGRCPTLPLRQQRLDRRAQVWSYCIPQSRPPVHPTIHACQRGLIDCCHIFRECRLAEDAPPTRVRQKQRQYE